MTMAAVIESPMAGTRTRSGTSRIARVDILHDMNEAATIWRGLEYPPQFATPYQRFDFQAAWQNNVGQLEGLKPFIVIAYDGEGQPLMLLPLGVAHENGMRIARFLGGKHSTFNMALWQRDFATTASKADLDVVFDAIGAHADGVDVLALMRQP